MTPLPDLLLAATTTTAVSDSGTSIVTPAIVAAIIAAVVSLGTFALAGRRARLDRQRQAFATAFAAVTAYREYPYIVRRRDPSKEADERIRISGALSAVQADIDVHRARLKIEDEYVGGRYELVVKATRRVAGAIIKSGWDKPGAGADAEVHAPDIDMSELDQYDKAYLQAVRDHLGPFWAPLRRRARREQNRATVPEDHK